MEKNYRSELTGVFGDPVDGNPTGIMEEAGYGDIGLNYRYLTMMVKKENGLEKTLTAKALYALLNGTESPQTPRTSRF